MRDCLNEGRLAMGLMACSLLSFWYLGCAMEKWLDDAVASGSVPKVQRVLVLATATNIHPTKNWVLLALEKACALGQDEIVKCLVERYVTDVQAHAKMARRTATLHFWEQGSYATGGIPSLPMSSYQYPPFKSLLLEAAVKTSLLLACDLGGKVARRALYRTFNRPRTLRGLLLLVEHLPVLEREKDDNDALIQTQREILGYGWPFLPMKMSSSLK